MTLISWANKTWNPIITGCTPVSEGCGIDDLETFEEGDDFRCYANKGAKRMSNNPNEKIAHDLRHEDNRCMEGQPTAWWENKEVRQ